MLILAIGVGSLALIRGEKLLPSRGELPALFLISTIFLLEHVCLLYALKSLKVPVAMSLIYTYPFIVAGLSIAAGKERPSVRLFLPLIVCLAGVVLVIGFSREQLDATGIAFALAQAVMAASRITLTASLVKDTSGLVLTARMLLLAVLLALPLTLFVSVIAPQNSVGWTALVCAGMSGMIGHTCLAQAVKRIEPVTFTFIMNLEPVAAALLSAFFVGQLLNVRQYIGAGLVIFAVICWSQLKRKVYDTARSAAHQ